MKPWYTEGLRFKCTGCGQCCTGPSGYVWVSPAEVQALAKRLNISPDEFIKKYTRPVDDRLVLKEIRRGSDYDCVFLKEKRCSVYEDRPQQCRTYPWWDDNLADRESWKQESLRCEGINHPDAPLISLGEINSHLSQE